MKKGNPLGASEREKLEADLSAYLDGELSEERAREIEQLLTESEDARRTLDELRGVVAQLQTLPRRNAPEVLAGSVLRHAEGRLIPGGARSGRGVRVLKLFARLSASAALLAVGVFVGYRVLKPPVAAGPASWQAPTAARSADRERLRDRVENNLTENEFVAKAPVPEAAARHIEESPAIAALGKADSRRGAKPAVAPERVTAGGTYDSDGIRDTAAGPQVSVWITPQSESEYAAAVLRLERWTTPRSPALGEAAGEKMGVEAGLARRSGAVADTVKPAAEAIEELSRVERVFTFQATELNQRIDELALDVGTAGQVRVRMDFLASERMALADSDHGEKDTEVAARAGRPPATPAAAAPGSSTTAPARLGYVATRVRPTSQPDFGLTSPATKPAESASEQYGWSLSRELTQRLIGVLLGGRRGVEETLLGLPYVPSTGPVGSEVSFHVTLLPPPTTSAPASQSAAPPDR